MERQEKYALVYQLLRTHKSIVDKFNEGKLDEYINGLCRTYYGCCGAGLSLMMAPSAIRIARDTKSTEYKLDRKELLDMITEFLEVRE